MKIKLNKKMNNEKITMTKDERLKLLKKLIKEKEEIVIEEILLIEVNNV